MLDVIDQKLIKELQRNGRQSNVEIAKNLMVAESTVRKRVKRLLNQNIMRVEAVPNPYKLGYGFISVMGLQVRMEDLQQVGKTLAENPSVYYLTFVTGRYDLIAIVMCRTPEELSTFIKENISTIASIIRTETFVNLEIIKSPWFGTSIIKDVA